MKNTHPVHLHIYHKTQGRRASMRYFIHKNIWNLASVFQFMNLSSVTKCRTSSKNEPLLNDYFSGACF